MADEKKKSWLDFRHPYYKAMVGKWNYTRDHYTGEVIQPDLIDKYLIRRKVGESVEAFLERRELADYSPHFSAIVDSLAGMLFAVEGDAARVFKDEKSGKAGLGDPMDPGTVIGRLWEDADGEGTDWLTFWRKVAIELIHQLECWILIDDVDGEPRIRLIPASSVLNWREEDGRVVEALVEETVDVRGSLRDEPTEETQYVYFTLDGWQRYRRDDEGDAVAVGNGGPYKYVSRTGAGILPLYRVKLPVTRHIGYSLAKKANAIFNKESERDHLLRVANFPYLLLFAGDDAFGKLVEALKRGDKALQVDPNFNVAHQFIAPSSGPAEVSSKVIERKVEEFYRVGFREYSDAAIERTATEIRQDVASGVGAFLSLLKAAVDDAETQAIHRIEQQQFPDDQANWFVGWVERSDTFLPMDVNTAVMNLRDRYFGQGAAAPVSDKAKVEALKKILEWDGITADEDGLLAAVRMNEMKELAQVFAQLPIPARAQAELVVRLISGLGVLDPDEKVELSDGEQASLIDIIRSESLNLAQDEEDRRRRQAEVFPI